MGASLRDPETGARTYSPEDIESIRTELAAARRVIGRLIECLQLCEALEAWRKVVRD